jgi:hypothetical protein
MSQKNGRELEQYVITYSKVLNRVTYGGMVEPGVMLLFRLLSSEALHR